MYSLYVNNFDSATERLTVLERDNSSFVAFLTACEKQKPCRGLRLRDFLILPVQVGGCLGGWVGSCLRSLDYVNFL